MDDVRTLDEQNYVDLFGGDLSKPIKATGFGSEMGDMDILSTIETTTLAPSTTDTTTLSTTETTTLPNTDILSTPDAANKGGRKPKYDFSDMSGYYQDRVTKGKFVKIDEEDNEGNKIAFVPKTPEDFDEVIDIQVNYKLEQERKTLEESIYNSKTPAWKTVLKFAEMVDDPSQMIPFLQGVRTIQSIQNVDENELEGAEKIVRTRMEQKNEPEEIIESQIEALKTTDKLIATAKQLKPIIVQQETQALQLQVKQEKEREQAYNSMIMEIRDSALKAIEAPIFGKQKLKQEEKAAIYDLIGEPSEQTSGYGIYTVIDNLFDKRDFETLKEVALLLQKRDAFHNYLGVSWQDKTHASLERKLRVAGENSNAGKDFDQDAPPTIQRNQFSKQPRFGK